LNKVELLKIREAPKIVDPVRVQKRRPTVRKKTFTRKMNSLAFGLHTVSKLHQLANNAKIRTKESNVNMENTIKETTPKSATIFGHNFDEVKD